jgi:hypothetical protein
MDATRAFYPMPQLRDCNSGYLRAPISLHLEPRWEIKEPALAADDHVGIDDQCHYRVTGFIIV